MLLIWKVFWRELGRCRNCMQQVQQQADQIKQLKGDLQTAQRESIHDRKRVEVKEFEKKLAKAEAKAEMATQLYKERASDELKKLREEVKKATNGKVGLS
jgi:F0F1-type ATP synthase membrane subunit b/b'